MAQKCVHKGCGKTFTDDNEDCIHHPEPPIFHEGQKGWKCCKPRVLTFDEFLNIPPCTTGKHSTVDDTPEPESSQGISNENAPPPPKLVANGNLEASQPFSGRLPQAVPAPSRSPAPVAAPESDSDAPDAAITDGVICKRKSCGVSSSDIKQDSKWQCIYHPGHAVFHEGSKGWSCCKKRVLEFDEFMKIEGCKTRDRHCFVGKRKAKRKEDGGEGDYEKLATVRHDFYQTGTTVHASLYLKKIDKEKSKVEFKVNGEEVEMDLKTHDGKEYVTTMPLYGRIDPKTSTFRIAGTKMDLTLAKADGLGWPVLRSDEKTTGEIIQTGQAGRA